MEDLSRFPFFTLKEISAMKSLTQCAAAATVALLSVVFVSAQDRREQDKPKATQPGAQRQPDNRVPASAQPIHGAGQHQGQGDRQIAACLMVDDEGEIALAKFALQKSENPEVKEFAEMMIQAHGECLQKLSKFAPNSTTVSHGSDASNPQNREKDRTVTTEDRAVTENRPANAAQKTPTNPQTNPNAKPTQAQPAGTRDQVAVGQLDYVRIKQEIGRKNVETLKKELGERKGADFDKCYIGQQIGAHLHLADTVAVVKNYASPQLRTVLEEGEQTVGEHLAHAKQLMKKLEGEKPSERTASKGDE